MILWHYLFVYTYSYTIRFMQRARRVTSFQNTTDIILTTH